MLGATTPTGWLVGGLCAREEEGQVLCAGTAAARAPKGRRVDEFSACRCLPLWQIPPHLYWVRYLTRLLLPGLIESITSISKNGGSLDV